MRSADRFSRPRAEHRWPGRRECRPQARRQGLHRGRPELPHRPAARLRRRRRGARADARAQGRGRGRDGGRDHRRGGRGDRVRRLVRGHRAHQPCASVDVGSDARGGARRRQALAERLMQDVIALYEQSLARRGFVSDSSQWRAVERLQQLYEEWTAYKARRDTRLKRLLVRPALPKGGYLWGAVGRGKSFLIDSFYLCVPLVRKRRVHFHHFMREIHRELDALKDTEDPIAALAERTARRCRLICFDEFHVSDIADAMILGRYLKKVMERGVVLCMTSNYHPDRLYEDGLQRDRFVPAIWLIKSRLDLVEVDGGLDYRRRKMERLKVYHAGPGSEAELERIFSDLRDVAEEKHTLVVEGRSIAYRRRAGGLVWVDFAVLCGGPRSCAAYVELARRFHNGSP